MPEVVACLQGQAKVIDEKEKSELSLFGPGAFGPKENSGGKPGPTDTASLFQLLSEDLKKFPDDFLDDVRGKGTRMKLPEEPLRLEQDSAGVHVLKTEDGIFAKVRNPAEGNFILYAQLRGHLEFLLPKEMIEIFKTVKAYENYVRNLRSRLFAKLFKMARQESIADYETDKFFQSLGLPKLEK